jgi:hypothetical protein
MRLVDDAHIWLKIQQRSHQAWAHGGDGTEEGLVIPAFPRGRVQDRHPVASGGCDSPDPVELWPPDLHDVLVPHADSSPSPTIAPRPPGDPHLVVHPGERVDAADLVTVSVPDEDVLHTRLAKQMQVLARVGGIQSDLRTRQTSLHD